MRSIPFLAVVAFLAIGPSLIAVQAATIEETCRAETESNADFKNCVVHETGRRSASFRAAGTAKACGGGTCTFRATYQESGKDKGKFIGGGLKLWTEPNESGRTYFVTAPDGRTSKFDQCGTCNYLDFEAGPIKEIDVKYDGVEAVMVKFKSSYIKAK